MYSSVAQESQRYGHFCTLDARVLLEGKQLVLGAHVDKIPGCTIREKKSHMYTASPEFVADMLSSSDAFFVKLEPGQLLATPSGFMLAVASIGTTSGIRWSVSYDESDNVRVKNLVAQMMLDFPELKGVSRGYQQWFDLLDVL